MPHGESGSMRDSLLADSSVSAITPGAEPLRVMFINTSLDVGGAETLLVNLVRRLDRNRFAPEVCCLKSKGQLGEMLSVEVPVFSDLLRFKFDVRILGRLVRLFRGRRIDAVVTVGAGDKMFWGRLAAWRPSRLGVKSSARRPDGYAARHLTGTSSLTAVPRFPTLPPSNKTDRSVGN